MSDMLNSDITPESLMDKFKGPGLVKMVIITVIVHVVVLVGTSLPYLKKSVLGADTSKMTKDERIAAAVADATEAIREIAEDHELNPQDISDQFASGGSRSAKQMETPEQTAEPENKAGDAAAEPEKPKSAIEKQLETKAEGPQMPTFDTKKDDIF